jgi:hypothetical protein
MFLGYYFLVLLRLPPSPLLCSALRRPAAVVPAMCRAVTPDL